MFLRRRSRPRRLRSAFVHEIVAFTSQRGYGHQSKTQHIAGLVSRVVTLGWDLAHRTTGRSPIRGHGSGTGDAPFVEDVRVEHVVDVESRRRVAHTRRVPRARGGVPPPRHLATRHRRRPSRPGRSGRASGARWAVVGSPTDIPPHPPRPKSERDPGTRISCRRKSSEAGRGFGVSTEGERWGRCFNRAPPGVLLNRTHRRAMLPQA